MCVLSLGESFDDFDHAAPASTFLFFLYRLPQTSPPAHRQFDLFRNSRLGLAATTTAGGKKADLMYK